MELFIFFACLLIFLVIAFIWQIPAVNHLDETVLSFFTGIRTDSLTSFFLIITEMGSIKILFPLIVLLSLVFLVKRNYIQIFFLFFVLWGARGLNEWIKTIIERPRPELDPLIFAAGSSFPSGHVMNSAAVYGFLIYFLWKKKAKKRLLWTFMLAALIICVSLSRLYFGVHYLTDVVAGLVGGLVLVYLANFIIPLLKKLMIKTIGGQTTE